MGIAIYRVICFGSASVAVLGGARIYYSMARDGVFFHGMMHIHPRWNTPITSLLAQCGWVIVIILSGGYEQLYTCFIFMMTLTYVATVGAVFILRRTQSNGRGLIDAQVILGCRWPT